MIWRTPSSKWRSRVADIAASGAPPSVACSLYGVHALTTLSYIGQIAFPPEELLRPEAAVLAQLLRVPYNAFSRNDFFSLAGWGSVAVQSVFVTLISILTRAALVTIDSWRGNYESLLHADLRSLAMLLFGQLCPAFWDTEPIAVTLHRAAAGFRDHPLLGQALPEIIGEAIALRTEASLSGTVFKFQGFIYGRLKGVLFPDSIPALLRRRWGVLDPEIPFESVGLGVLKQFLLSLTPAWATAILKTWANAWITTSRMHEAEVRDYVFGCTEECDELSHYISCWRLRSLLRVSPHVFVPISDSCS